MEALRFFFVHVLKRRGTVDDIPYPKRPHTLPLVLSHDEVARLINAAANPFHRVVLMTLYATGMRRTEVTRLKIADIDTQRMVVHIRAAKGRKDRDVMLSPKLLEVLRQHWRSLKPKPTVWLFPGGREHTDIEHPINDKVVWQACERAAHRAGMEKPIHPHTFRHASAYYTTFQSPFILKTIVLGRARSAGVYGRRAGPLSLVPGQPAETSLFSR